MDHQIDALHDRLEQAVQDHAFGDKDSVKKVFEAFSNLCDSRHEGRASISDQPIDLLENAISLLISELGPNDQLFSGLLKLVQSVQGENDCRLLLQYLPWAVPPPETENESIHKTLSSVLEDVVSKDKETLVSVLTCLSDISKTAKDQVRNWKLVLTHVDELSETELALSVKILLRCVTNKQEAHVLFDAIRKEFRDVKDSFQDISLLLLAAFQDQAISEFVVDAYQELLENISIIKVESDNRQFFVENEISQTRYGEGLLLFDTAALVGLYVHPSRQEAIEKIMDRLLEAGQFPLVYLQAVLSMQKKGTHYDNVPSSFISIGIYLVMAPTRNVAIDNTFDLQSSVQKYLVDVYHAATHAHREDIIKCLLNLGEEMAVIATTKKRSRSESHSYDEKCDRLNQVGPFVYQTLELLASSDKGFSKSKEILFNRLVSTNHSDGGFSINKSLCKTIVALVEPIEKDGISERGIETHELFVLLQSLLFGTKNSCQEHPCRFGTGTDMESRGSGIMLATEMLKSLCLSHDDAACIREWVLRILLPTNGKTIDATIGPCGLDFLRAWSIWQSTSDRDVKPENTAFQNVKAIMARTGLIQLRSNYDQRYISGKQTTLAYTYVPECFRCESIDSDQVGNDVTAGSRRRNPRSMVLCSSWFLRVYGMKQPSRWNLDSHWVHQLLNTYLSMGRKASNDATRSKRRWVPDGWMEAAIELPVVSIQINASSKDRQQRYDECIREIVQNFGDGNSPSYQMIMGDSEFIRALAKNKSLSQIREEIESLCRFVLVLQLSVSASFAILRNSYEHYLDVSCNGASQSDDKESRRRELLGLLKYQLSKSYDLKTKGYLVVALLEAFKRALRQVSPVLEPGAECFDADESRESKQEKIDDVPSCDIKEVDKTTSDVGLAIEQTLSVLGSHFSSKDRYDQLVLWECLIQKSDDEIVKSAVTSYSEYSPQCLIAKHKLFERVINFRQEVIDHMALMVGRRAVTDHSLLRTGHHSFPRDVTERLVPTSGSEEPNIASSRHLAIHREGFRNCIEMITFFSHSIPRLRRVVRGARFGKEALASVESVNCVQQALTNLINILQAYLSLVLSILANAAEGGVRRLTFQDCLQICRSALLEDPDAGCSLAPGTNDESSDILSYVFVKFLSLLRTCEDSAIAMAFVDILSLLAAKGESKLLDSSRKAALSVLHTVYSSETPEKVAWFPRGGEADPPHMFLLALRRHWRITRNNHMVLKALQSTLFKNAFGKRPEQLEHASLRNGFLSLWGNLVYDSAASLETADIISLLIDTLWEFLEHVNEKRDSSLFHDGKNQAHASSIPGLTFSSFPLYFELVLYVIVGTLALSPPATAFDSPDHHASSSNEVSPFLHLANLLHEFGRILDLYTEHRQLFPKQGLSVVLMASEHVLNLALDRVHMCVDWRQHQPCLSKQEKLAGRVDRGSVKFLKQLIDSLAANGPGKVCSFCDVLRSSSSARRAKRKSNGVRPHGWLSESVQKKIVSLKSSAEDCIEALREVSLAHNVTFTASQKTSTVNHVAKERKRVRKDTKGYHELERLSPGASAPRGQRKRQKRRIEPSLLSAKRATTSQQNFRKDPATEKDDKTFPLDLDHDKNEQEDKCRRTDDTAMGASDSDSDNSFAIDGNWDEEESSIESLELEVNLPTIRT